jgi:hypothetical protein
MIRNAIFSVLVHSSISFLKENHFLQKNQHTKFMNQLMTKIFKIKLKLSINLNQART